MNTKDMQKVSFQDAVRAIVTALEAGAKDKANQGLDEGPEIFWRTDDKRVRIYTRDSRQPERNANGGDYDFWLDVSLTSDGVIIEDDWSADWDYADWGGSVYILPQIKSQAAYKRLIEIAFARYCQE